MPEITATIPHQLGRAEARRRIQGQVGNLRQSFGSVVSNLDENWTGDTMAFSATALGQTVSGHATVEDHAVQVTVSLPWMLHLLAGTVKSRIEHQGRQMLRLERKN